MKKDFLYWCELCLFNPAKEDCGVSEVLNNFAKKPDGIVFLFSDISFYNLFTVNNREYALRLSDCIYGGENRVYKKENINWTNYKLKKLVSILQKQNIGCFATVFDIVADMSNEFYIENPGILQKIFDGTHNNSVDITAKINNVPYAEFLGKKIADVVEYFGFDGVHLADGISSRRIPVQSIGFSDEEITDFANKKISDAEDLSYIKALTEKNRQTKKENVCYTEENRRHRYLENKDKSNFQEME